MNHFTRCGVTFICVLLAAGVATANWTETNNDGGTGGLDYMDYWVAAYNGSAPGPATNWYKAGDLAVSGWGSDPGWYDNVVAITDADATAYAAENKVESFYNVRAYVAVSTVDSDEEFGAMVRAMEFDMDDSPSEVTCYGATFSFNNAVNPGDPMEFNLYKVIGGLPARTVTANPPVPVGSDDYIVAIELEAVGRYITARLYEDYGDATAVAELTMYDYDALGTGYTGVINLDYESADGIGALYDTLSSETFDQPIVGDFDGDWDVDADDIDDLRDHVGTASLAYDLDNDGDVDEDDLEFLVVNYAETPPQPGTAMGDFNLDGAVNNTDLTILAMYFGDPAYEPAGWAYGNANADTVVNNTDLTILAANFGYDSGGGASTPLGPGVPEPVTALLLLAGAGGMLKRRRRQPAA